MTEKQIIQALAYINAIYPEYKIPPDGVIQHTVDIWKEALGGAEPGIVKQAIKEHYKSSRFYPHLSDLLKKIDVATKAQLPEASEVVSAIRLLARNSGQDISGQPEHIREVVRLMGGLSSLGMKQWDQWLEKDILRVYEEWKVTSTRRHDLERLTGVKSIGTEG